MQYISLKVDSKRWFLKSWKFSYTRPRVSDRRRALTGQKVLKGIKLDSPIDGLCRKSFNKIREVKACYLISAKWS